MQLAAWIAVVALGLALGCVRSVTVCATYDRQLQRPDSTTGLSRDAAGASVCAEAGPQ